MSYTLRLRGKQKGVKPKKEADLSQILLQMDELFADEPFDPDDYVERLSYRAGKIQSSSEKKFDPNALHKAFDEAIQHLQKNYEIKKRQCSLLETLCREKETSLREKAKDLFEKHKAANGTFNKLDKRIEFVATKVVHIGHFLESINTPRNRSVEAQKLMEHFTALMSMEPVANDALTGQRQLYEDADIIQKLHVIAQELPSGKPSFGKAIDRIDEKYQDVEIQLIGEFAKAHKSDDRAKMKKVAAVLSNFKGFSQCVDEFIERMQRTLPATGDILGMILPSCTKAHAVIEEVFPNPEQVMSKYILNVLHGKLRTHIKAELMDDRDLEPYLEKLEILYSKSLKLTNDLSGFNVSSDPLFLNKLIKNIFSRYLENYSHIESRYLQHKCENTLNLYYNSKNHDKKQIHDGGIYELRRDIQARISSRASNDSSIDKDVGELLLSEKLAWNILQHCKKAFNRCKLLSSQPSEISGNAVLIFDILLRYIFEEHISYAIDLGLSAFPLVEQRPTTEIFFFDVVCQCNAIYLLFEKEFDDTILPLVVSNPKLGECLQKKMKIVEKMESKLHTGLKKSVASMSGSVKFILQSEQKKTDFKPRAETAATADKCTTACNSAVKFITECVKKIKDTIDGKNLEAVLSEFGSKLHRVIFDHLQLFQYSSVGAMVVICDLSEYRRCVAEFGVPLLNALFETLYALSNLLVVEPVNVKQMCAVDQLACLDRLVLKNFVQLRADYKPAKIYNQFR